MHGKRPWVALGAWILCSALAADAAVPAEPLLEVHRPAGNAPALHTTVRKRYGEAEIPYARAPISVTGPEDFATDLTADLLGKAQFSFVELFQALKERPQRLTLSVSVSLDRKRVTQEIMLSEEELLFYLKNSAEVLVDEGNRLAEEGRLREALKKYEGALKIHPWSGRAAHNRALALEKLGMRYAALSAYSDYLLKHASKATDRQTLKAKMIKIARSLDPPPPVSVKALRVMEEGRKAVKAREYFAGIYHYEAVQSLAPWWPEPYYSQGLVSEHLAYQNNTHYFTPAIQNFNLFLEAADPKDPRIAEVKKRIQDMQKIEEGLKAPKMIRVR